MNHHIFGRGGVRGRYSKTPIKELKRFYDFSMVRIKQGFPTSPQEQEAIIEMGLELEIRFLVNQGGKSEEAVS